jgi:hypothetical protein
MPMVAFDLDNVVVDIVEAAREALAASAGVPASQIFDTHVYYAPFGHVDAAVMPLLATPHDFWQREDVLAAARPLAGAREALVRLHEAGMLAGYITRRAGRARGITRAWLEIHDMPSVDLHLVGHHDARHNHDGCKARVCLDIGATHLVDDSQREAEDALRLGVTPILVDHPLGREARAAWLALNPDVFLARDAGHAVDHLTT